MAQSTPRKREGKKKALPFTQTIKELINATQKLLST